MMDDVIDLCSSGEEEPIAVVAVSKPQHSFLELSDDEDNRQVIAPKSFQQKKNLVTPEAGQKVTSAVDGGQHKVKKPRSLFNSTETEEDSDSDDELLNFHGLATRKETTAARSSYSTENNVSAPLSDMEEAKYVSLKPPPKLSPVSSDSKLKKQEFFNPYAKRPASSSNIQSENAQYPTFGHCGRYDDLRACYLLAFWKFSRTLVHASYNLGKLDQFAKKVNSLALSRFPIRSFEEYCHRFAGTSDTNSIQDALQSDKVSFSSINNVSSDDGRYFSIAEACLVSMLCHIQSRSNSNENLDLKNISDVTLQSILQEKDSWIFLSDLLPMIDSRLKEICPGELNRPSDADNGASYYNEKSTRSAEYKQIEKLQSKQRDKDAPYIKSHRKNGKVCFELTILGYNTAIWIQKRSFPSLPGHYRTSNLPQIELRYQGICLAVDKREGGGPKKKLHQMCNKLDTLKIPYLVCTLDIGDYCFFADQKLLPVLIERKSIQDVAQSIYDGRWLSQKKRMYHGQYVFGYKYCRMAYIIEGKKETQQLTGGYVGERQFNVTSEKLDEEIANLQSEGFDVLRTQSSDHSMVELSRWAIQVLKDYQDEKFVAKYTLQEFQSQVKKIRRTVDFSRIAKDMVKSSQSSDQQTHRKKPDTSSNRKTIVQTTLVPVPNEAKIKAKLGNEYKGWTVAQLQKECVKVGLPKSGKKADLISRLNGPHPPKLLLERKAQNEYVPARYSTCATALLVALWIKQSKAGENWKGMIKEELYAAAESLDISKDPFSGVTAGSFKYDGWSSMSDLRSGEIPLVVLKKGSFKLTSSSSISGYPFAETLHKWVHEHNVCRCSEIGFA
mmetsp:Transcript_882/g.1257  ORF Transcript_882/g.1257 Transcript_882/m.1257 type:complete len:839 (+) Transcript_882:72-2588(+)